MAKATKQKSEETVAEQTTESTETTNSGTVIVEANPEVEVSEEPIVTVTISETPVWGETPNEEVEFLKQILKIQHEGCFGRHLDSIINERIKSLQK